MTDEQYANRLAELDARGKDALQEMRDFIKTNGGMGRVIALAVRGATRAKRAEPKAKAVALPADFPDVTARAAAIAHWLKAGRPDLEGDLERQVDKFRGHFEGTRRPSWARTWGNWYRNAPEYTQPPRDGRGALVAFEQTTLPGWIERVRLYYGLEDDCPKGTWSPKWGGPPGQAGCRVPAEALAVAYSESTGVSHGG